MFSWKKKFNFSGGDKAPEEKNVNKQGATKHTQTKSETKVNVENVKKDSFDSPQGFRRQTIVPTPQSIAPIRASAEINREPISSNNSFDNSSSNIDMSKLNLNDNQNYESTPVSNNDLNIPATKKESPMTSAGILTLKLYTGDGFALPFPLVYNPQLLSRLLNSSANKQPANKMEELATVMENLTLSNSLDDSQAIPGNVATKFIPSTITLPGSSNLNPLIYFTIEFDNTTATIQPESGTMDHPVFNKISTFDVTRKLKHLRIDVFCRIPSILLPQSLLSNAQGNEVLEKVMNNQDVHLLTFNLPLNLEEYTANSVRLYNHKWIQISENGSKLNLTIDYKPLSNKKLSIDDFELLKVIGKGSFGKVMQVKKKDTQKIYALKALRKAYIVNNSEIVHTLAERTVLARIDCPFIVPLKFSFQSKEKLYLVLALINGGELFYHLQREGRFSLSRSRFYTAELLIALESLHAMNIVYRDLKPENILLDYQGHIALCDFGLCKLDMKQEDKTSTFCGTPEYLAPELLLGHGYTRVVDWWTLGVLLYEMLTGLPPYYDEDVPKMYKKILQEPLRFPDGFDEDAKDLLIRLLNRDPAKRLGANGSSEIKKHPFFSQLSWKRLMLKGYIPPYKPPVEDTLDTSNFDTEFTGQRPVDSVVNDFLSESVQKQFGGWTYVGSEQLDSTQN
ncbi:Pkinase-domain-containing protein [Hanseniaspora valbyensis NRRL Y-1626]|uniref:non-specific serine/threonine protein kinase n=1 Tax=Hanseniaspora valbyensis NRRL Y-1626 TaxID=766949 RepID=A0A1B7TJD8_9ASCO|nr:Pkinase-domain-containing protein [Hanseniaspora valbyensis NRRL Y-1626]